ncbi:hypothetical protein J4727_10820 [Providencia rettgeri]|uniref:Uncharacterized protein n=1 Tax=Providencia rettgeri TaxID=587 RepID=A0A939NCD5_PRORE|nr:hypothetical protein [Providencia rettgeri]
MKKENNEKNKYRSRTNRTNLKNGDFKQLLTAGEHHLNDWFNRLTVSLFTLDNEPIDEKLADHLRQFHPDWVDDHCIDIALTDDEIGLFTCTIV